MGIIQRRLIWETMLIIVFTNAAALLLLTTTGAIKEAIDRGLPIHVVLDLLPYLVPEALRFTMPAAVLYAVCHVVGRMAAAHEFTALKSLGIDPLRALAPLLFLSTLLSLLTFWFYDVCAHWSRPNMQRIFVTSICDVAYGTLQVDKSFATPQVSITVRQVDDRRLLDPIITVAKLDDSPPMTLSAEEASLSYDSKNHALCLVSFGTTIDVAGRGTVYWPGPFQHRLPLPGWRHEAHKLSPAALPVSLLGEQEGFERERSHTLAAQIAALKQQPGEEANLHTLESQYRASRERAFRLAAESQRRLANGFGCLCFALTGTAVAMWLRSGDTAKTFFLCFLPILLVYYPLLVSGETLARQGIAPGLSVWLADAVLFAIATVMLVRMRH